MKDLKLFDTHCHLDFPKFGSDREKVLERARKLGVAGIINPGVDLESSRRSIELAEKYDDVFAAVGVHPHDAKTLDDATLKEIEELAAHPKVVAIGETGLDYYRNLSPGDVQRDAFAAQLELARRLGKPVIVHQRDSAADVRAMLADWVRGGGVKGGVLHSFSGDVGNAREMLQMGFYIGISGPVTYDGAKKTREVVKMLPLDRVLLETDAPFLPPQPHRGRRNEPAFVAIVAREVAALRNMDEEELARASTENAGRLFSVDV